MILAGVLSLVAGESPTILAQKLKVFLDGQQLAAANAADAKKEDQ
jgi:flagellar motor component MotA